MAGPTQNPLGARHQAATRWRSEEGQSVGSCEMLWVGDVGDWRGVVCAEGGGEVGEGRSTWVLWKWLGSWLQIQVQRALLAFPSFPTHLLQHSCDQLIFKL